MLGEMCGPFDRDAGVHRGWVSVTRVTRQSGEDVEAVVGMLLCSVHRTLFGYVQVRATAESTSSCPDRPGGAKGGPSTRSSGTAKTSPAREAQDQKLVLSGCVEASEKEGWRITEWHLVMPLDLTSHNLGWLDRS